jgi:hypothetical protein
MRQKIHCLDDVRIHMNPDAVVINATSLGGPIPDDDDDCMLEADKIYRLSFYYRHRGLEALPYTWSDDYCECTRY